MPEHRRAASWAQQLLRFLAASWWVVTAVPATAVATDYPLHDLRIEHPYARPTPPGARTGSAYFTIRNDGHNDERLVGVASPASKSAEVHQTTMDGNVMRMRAVPTLDIPAGRSVTLEPGSYHVMLVGLAHSLSLGDKVPLTLTFQNAGTVDVVADVEPGAPHAPAQRP
jgi:copper(I)-binding protein